LLSLLRLQVKDQILKLASINLCPNLSGQICCALMMNPPQPGEPSYDMYTQVSKSHVHVNVQIMMGGCHIWGHDLVLDVSVCSILVNNHLASHIAGKPHGQRQG
jgi:hypothetical protein